MATNKTANPGLTIGWGVEDITLEGSVSLFGQYYERISEYVESPLQVIACAIENTDEKGIKDQAIMVSVDVAFILRDLHDALKVLIKDLIPDFDSRKLFLTATHTHSAPYPELNSDYGKLLLSKLSNAVVSAWVSRAPAGISPAYGYAVIGHNRRVIYDDGTAEMYGDTNRDDFIGIEGPSDHGVDLLFCWDEDKNLTGIVVNVSCPAQVTEAKYFVTADYWSEVRKQMKAMFSKDVYVLGQCGAAGDISPRDLSAGYKTDEPNMWDLPGMIEIGRRLANLIREAYSIAKNNIQTDIPFAHVVRDIHLPARRVGVEEYEKARAMVSEIRSREPEDANDPGTAWNKFLQEIKENEQIKSFGPWDNKKSDFGWLRPQELVLKQYENQDQLQGESIELHVIRLGEIAFATNPFELFVDYGFMITARSKAKQTFIVQLACDYKGYLPTVRALAGGGYSAMATPFGPTAAQILVNETVESINNMWQ